jgi:hypothetical protein
MKPAANRLFAKFVKPFERSENGFTNSTPKMTAPYLALPARRPVGK